MNERQTTSSTNSLDYDFDLMMTAETFEAYDRCRRSSSNSSTISGSSSSSSGK